MNKVNVYEYFGILCPGAVTLSLELWGSWSFLWQRWDDDQAFSGATVSIVFFILSFCIGHIIQAIANVFEDLTGYPRKITIKYFEQDEEITGKNNVIDVNFVRMAYNCVLKKGSIERVDIFNRQYGLMRGLLVTSLMLLAVKPTSCFLPFFIGYRMHHFAKLYSKELLLEYRMLSANEKDK
ncbi:MAG: hypothetical protein LBP41_02945 [Holosporaceae bacterium]|jgi:hypothetical protein|nr:hypothetical protein [Holosporaceae bacterium]